MYVFVNLTRGNVVLVSLQAPLQLYGLEGRYAHAIFSAAKKQNKLDAVDKDFQGISVRICMIQDALFAISFLTRLRKL